VITLESARLRAAAEPEKSRSSNSLIAHVRRGAPHPSESTVATQQATEDHRGPQRLLTLGPAEWATTSGKERPSGRDGGHRMGAEGGFSRSNRSLACVMAGFEMLLRPPPNQDAVLGARPIKVTRPTWAIDVDDRSSAWPRKASAAKHRQRLRSSRMNHRG